MGIIGDRNTQEAGNGSTQVQISNLCINNNGIDEKRAREIIDERCNELLLQYSEEARTVAFDRVERLANILIPRLVKENLLEQLRDPSIQITLKETEKSAMSTERKLDNELLSELLVHRIQKGENRNIRAGVNQAIKIVDEISDDALLGLTVIYTMSGFYPTSPQLEDGLKTMSKISSKIVYGELPLGDEWIEHLDILNAIRIIPYSSIRKVIDFYMVNMPGIIDVGIAKDSDNYRKAIEILRSAYLSEKCLFSHELRDGYVRLGVTNINTINLDIPGELCQKGEDGLVHVVMTKQQLKEAREQAFRDVYALYEKDEIMLQENRRAFMERWNSYDSLRKVSEWINSINSNFTITSVGKALAHANAKRCDSSIPDMY